jgi:hypothetical protein
MDYPFQGLGGGECSSPSKRYPKESQSSATMTGNAGASRPLRDRKVDHWLCFSGLSANAGANPTGRLSG